MVPSRALLGLVAALVLPLTVLQGCGDDSSSNDDMSNGEGSDSDSSSADDQDARVKSMDAALRDAGGKSDGAVPSGDNGEAMPMLDAAISADGGDQDAKVEGMDAAVDPAENDAAVIDAEVTGDAAQADAEQDASESDADAGEPSEADSSAAESDAETDSGEDASMELTVLDCTSAGGAVLAGNAQCSAGQMKYDLAEGLICCLSDQPPPSSSDPCDVDNECPDGQFCDYSASNGGGGCDDPTKSGKCREIPAASCQGVMIQGGCGCDGNLHTTCDAWQKSIPVEIGDPSCINLPAMP